MARLNLTAEGPTEQAFAFQVLRPHLAPHAVYLAKPRCTALCRRKGRVHRGGMNRYLPVKNDIVRWLREDQSADSFFTTMIDLYGLPRDFPGYGRAETTDDPYKRIAVLEDALGEDIGDQRFIPHIQLHEFEALLFADPSAFASYYHRHRREIGELLVISATFESPELIDDGEQTAPSKRIAKIIPEYSAAKPTAGPIIAAHIGLETIRAKCSHFDRWLTRLEGLANP